VLTNQLNIGILLSNKLQVVRKMDFGQRIRELRRERNLSQRDLAAKIGIDFTYLSKIEVGRMEPPSEPVIRRMAQELGADEDELINLAGKVPKELKAVLDDNPEAVELLRVLSEQRLPDDTYRTMLGIVRKAQSEASSDKSPSDEETEEDT
jgi:HTH-type transcriptional regulator, competence development regulator